MRKKLLPLWLAALTALPGILQGQGVENPNVGNRFGPTTQVPSAGQGRRVITPTTPNYGSGNDIVTGNVSGMKYFRGVVPYGSSYYTGNALDGGTAAVDNFLRRSADPIAADRNPGQIMPYYQPERTTTKFVRPQALAPPAGPAVSAAARSGHDVLNTTPQMLDTKTRQRPLSTDTRQIEELLARQNLLAQETARPLSSTSRLLTERVVIEPAERPDQLPAVPLLPQDRTLKTEPQLLPEQQVQTEFQKEIDKALQEQKSIRKEHLPEGVTGEKAAEPAATEEQGLLNNPEQQAAMAAEGRKIMGEHKTYESLAYTKYAGYMTTAEAYIKEGKFYKAADIYELAALWRPDESRSYLGKGFALFGAGEYMSSSYYISRAIELEPSLASRSFELANLLGDRDKFENRLLEIKEWQDKSGSGELAFLQAYVLYQDGKTEAAAEAIAKAVKAMPDSKAVQRLNDVISPQPQPPL